MNMESIPDYSGKCLSMSLIDDDASHDLFDPHFENQGGRLFIMGTLPKGSSDSGWNDNKIGGVAWDRVKEYVIFDSLEEYHAAVKISDDHKEESASRDT